MINQNNVIEIVGDGYKIKMAPLYRDFPDSDDFEEGNWITTNFWLDIPQRPTLFTYSVHLDDLRRFQQDLLRLREEQQGRAVLAMREEFLRVEAVLSAGGNLHWWVTASIPSNRHADKTVLPTLTYDFDSDPSAWLIALDQVKAVLKRFPIKLPQNKVPVIPE